MGGENSLRDDKGFLLPLTSVSLQKIHFSRVCIVYTRVLYGLFDGFFLRWFFFDNGFLYHRVILGWFHFFDFGIVSSGSLSYTTTWCCSFGGCLSFGCRCFGGGDCLAACGTTDHGVGEYKNVAFVKVCFSFSSVDLYTKYTWFRLKGREYCSTYYEGTASNSGGN